NIFTPNGDGTNDYFYIRNLPPKGSGTEIVISNRWGKQVYTSDDYYTDPLNLNDPRPGEHTLWDADGQADGIYFYSINFNSLGEQRSGWIEVLRTPIR
ncbi:MAG: gliding motility-associated C-terminal domain-containing protein, partial [Cyclobacteriaceae bacterium]|nr:gliding motility-associated C-terminal domain-containing protein [Cyclobacteriaceae bacterium]